jgi:hypothetical protein
MIRLMCSILSAAPLAFALAGCSVPGTMDANQAAHNATLPGWTGTTFVVGSNSTIAGDAEATYQQQKWQLGRER